MCVVWVCERVCVCEYFFFLSLSQACAMLAWGVRLPFFLLLLSLYVLFPSEWPRSTRHSDYVGLLEEEEEEEEETEAEEAGKNTTKNAYTSVAERKQAADSIHADSQRQASPLYSLDATVLSLLALLVRKYKY